MTLTWQVLSQAGDPIWSISKVAPPWTWWPSLYPDICKLAFGAPANWDMEGYSDPDMKAPNVPSPPGRYGLDPWGGCGHPSRRSQLRTLPFYICPGFHRAVALNPTCVWGEAISSVKIGGVRLQETHTGTPPPHGIISLSQLTILDMKQGARDGLTSLSVKIGVSP